VLLLLAAQAGLVQLPQPQLPKLPEAAAKIPLPLDLTTLFCNVLLSCRGVAAAGCASRLGAAAAAATAPTAARGNGEDHTHLMHRTLVTARLDNNSLRHGADVLQGCCCCWLRKLA
jgi:hypothetical protein